MAKKVYKAVLIDWTDLEHVFWKDYNSYEEAYEVAQGWMFGNSCYFKRAIVREAEMS